MRNYDVAGIPISAMPSDAAAATIVEAGQRRLPLEVHLCNAYTLSLVDRDPELREALVRAHLNLPDGTPVAWLGRRHGVRRPVRGPALVSAVAERGIAQGIGHYFFGGAPGVADEMASRLQANIPGLKVVGVESPPYQVLSDEELDDLARRIVDSDAGVVWVGLGTPRQDHLVRRLGTRVNAAIVPVGAAFDFISGRVQMAPTWMHGSGLEWIYRFVKEPRRLWRRYTIGNARFVILAIRKRRP